MKKTTDFFTRFIKNFFVVLFQMLIYAVLGGFSGVLLADRLVEIYSEVYMVYLYLIVFLLQFYMSMILSVIIHEGGHLVFGLLSGYKFLSFRIFSLIWVKYDDSLKLKHYKIPGTAGQCLMSPCEYNDGDFPHIMYNLGGGLLNLTTGILFFILAGCLNMNLFWYSFSLCMFINGIAMALTNLIPMKIGGIGNDGKNILSLSKDKSAKRAFWVQLHINSVTTKGTRLSELDESLFSTEGIDKNNVLCKYVYLVKIDRLLDMGLYEEALALCDEYLNEGKVFSDSHAMKAERLYLMMLMGKITTKEQLKENMDALTKSYLKMTKTLPSAIRFSYAQGSISKIDSFKLKKIKRRFVNSLKKSPNLAANELERKLFEDFEKFSIQN